MQPLSHLIAPSAKQAKALCLQLGISCVEDVTLSQEESQLSTGNFSHQLQSPLIVVLFVLLLFQLPVFLHLLFLRVFLAEGEDRGTAPVFLFLLRLLIWLLFTLFFVCVPAEPNRAEPTQPTLSIHRLLQQRCSFRPVKQSDGRVGLQHHSPGPSLTDFSVNDEGNQAQAGRSSDSEPD
ncbi:hypothetical protein INR49_029920 [Caranx melampygus]|nr:hypothetical protein INR49_029920 [Caranx melampygus]